MSFETATAVTDGPGRWSANLEEGWDIFGVTNGGYLMAIATRAMEAETDGRLLISATGSFTNPANPRPVDVAVESLKQGRSLSTLRATISREGRDLVYVTGVYADPDRPIHPARLARTGPPDLPTPEDCILTEPADDAPIPPPFTGKVELRVPSEDIESFGAAAEPRSRGWFRLRNGEGLSAHAVVLATDAFPPAIFYSNLAVGWTPTVDLAVQIRDPSPTGWLACQYATRFVSGGMLEEDGEIWDENGNLVALSRQLALVPR
ncbi:MAG TPA: thioesterase family protein [Acidimicrobiia bacterium]